MIPRQQCLQINEIPPCLQTIRPKEPRLARHRITSRCSESESHTRGNANFFTRSLAGEGWGWGFSRHWDSRRGPPPASLGSAPSPASARLSRENFPESQQALAAEASLEISGTLDSRLRT